MNEPKSPNTNPAMATAATSVIAISMTVASTGEMAFLSLMFLMFILCIFDPEKLLITVMDEESTHDTDLVSIPVHQTLPVLGRGPAEVPTQTFQRNRWWPRW